MRTPQTTHSADSKHHIGQCQPLPQQPSPQKHQDALPLNLLIPESDAGAISASATSDTKRLKTTIVLVRSHLAHAPPRYHPSSPQIFVQCQMQPAQPLQKQERHASLSCCTVLCSYTLTRHTTASPSQTSCQHAAFPLRTMCGTYKKKTEDTC